MGLFEFFGERRNPGPIGDLDVHPPEEAHHLGLTVRAVLAGLLLTGWGYGLTQWTSSLNGLAAAASASGLYLIAGYFVHPKPDYSNLGLLGGAIDHPFRFSDDANRFLMVLLGLLWPARFLSTTCVEVWRAVRGA